MSADQAYVCLSGSWLACPCSLLHIAESAHGESPGEERLHGRPFDQAIQAKPYADEETLGERLEFPWYIGVQNGRRVDRVKDAMAGDRFLQGSSGMCRIPRAGIGDPLTPARMPRAMLGNPAWTVEREVPSGSLVTCGRTMRGGQCRQTRQVIDTDRLEDRWDF
jgi:hypothetical protein